MNEIKIEYRHAKKTIAIDLAQHIFKRQNKGHIAVVTERPVVLMGTTCKQWKKIIRRIQRDSASTLDLEHRAHLDEIIFSMQNTSFSAKDPSDDVAAYVLFASVKQFLAAPPSCSTMYITEPIDTLTGHMLTAWMPRDTLVVIYG